MPDAIDAALNNAQWCAAVWRAHGLPVESQDGLWLCAAETPPFYPNVVTIDPGADPSTQADFIRSLADRSGFDISVKDSFDRLQLDRHGFRRLFSASWLRLEPVAVRSVAPTLSWRRIEPFELPQWELAWGGAAARIFPDPLLDDPRVLILAGFDAAGTIAGGGIGFEAADVLGLTNVFGPRNELIAALLAHFQSSALVAYETGEDLRQAEQYGFEPLGSLTVWSRAARMAEPRAAP